MRKLKPQPVTLQDWGKVKLRFTTIRISADIENEEWVRIQKFASARNMTIAAIVRAGVRKILEEAGVNQPTPQVRYEWEEE